MLRENNVVDPFRMGLRLGAECGDVFLGLLFAVVNTARVSVSKVEVEIPCANGAISSAGVSVRRLVS